MRHLMLVDNGEVIKDDKLDPDDKVRILRKESYDYLTQRVEINEKEPYIKVYTKTMFEVARRLDGVSNQLMNLLITFISYEDGVLQHPNGKVLTRSNIIEYSQLNEKTVDKSIDKLASLQIIGKHKTGRTVCYTANPFLFMKGRRVSKTLVKLYEKSEWAKCKL